MAVAALPEIEPRSYLNHTYGLRSWLLTTDHKRIALLTWSRSRSMFFIGGAAATLMRIELLTPRGRSGHAGNLQQAFHHARRRHGFVLPDPVDSRGARQFSRSPDDRRARCGVSRSSIC